VVGEPSSPRTWSWCCCGTGSPFWLVSIGGAASAGRSRVHRCACSSAPAPAPTWPRGDTSDAAALASRAGAQEMDLPSAQTRPAGDRPGAAGTGAAARTREPGLGLPTDRWRADQARSRCAASTYSSSSSSAAGASTSPVARTRCSAAKESGSSTPVQAPQANAYAERSRLFSAAIASVALCMSTREPQPE
jgi:hypothetical protein